MISIFSQSLSEFHKFSYSLRFQGTSFLSRN